MQMQEFVKRADELLGAKDDMHLKSLLARHSNEDIAQAISGLDNGKRKLFALLPPERQAVVALTLGEADKDYIFPRLQDNAIARFLHFSDEDDATDVLQHLPEQQRPRVLQHMQPEKRRKIEKLLTFGAETAGGVMDLNFMPIDGSSTVQDVRSAVQEYAKTHKQVPVIVLIDGAKGSVLGTLSHRDLLVYNPQHKALDIAKKVVVIPAETDREQVLRLLARAQSDVACVQGGKGELLGIIQSRDLLKVAQAEASEDAYRMSAMTPLEGGYLTTSFFEIWRNRSLWLSVLFVAELFTFTALASFEKSIAAVTALALFVPLCVSTGGNSGSQAATLITRAMALGELTPRDWWRVLKHEFLLGIALGATLGVIGLFRAYLTPQSVLGVTDRWTLALVIGQSVAAICLWGTLVGSMMPLILKKLGLDPAYASSPFVATFVDVTGIVIYFSIANAMILHGAV